MSTMCERCNREPKLEGKRYCKECKKVVLQEMKDAGYFNNAICHNSKAHPLEDSRYMDLDHILKRISEGTEGKRKTKVWANSPYPKMRYES